MMVNIRRRMATSWLCIAWWCAMPAVSADVATAVQFKIDAPTMAAALIQFTQQTGLQLMYPTNGASDPPAPRLQGTFTPRAALEQLLQDSGLTFEFVNAHTIVVTSRALAAPRALDDGRASSAVVRERS